MTTRKDFLTASAAMIAAGGAFGEGVSPLTAAPVRGGTRHPEPRNRHPHYKGLDWSTFYPNIPDANPDPNFWRRESHFNKGFATYGKGGDTWNRRIELYLLDCGVTADEIAVFRSIMLEPC